MLANDIILSEKLKTIWKKLQITLRNYIQISQRKGKKKGSNIGGYVGVSAKITADTSKTLKIYSSFKSKFPFNNRNIVKIYVILELGKMLVLMIFLN